LTVKKRINAIRLYEKITLHKTFAEKIGLSAKLIPIVKLSDTVIESANKQHKQH